MTEGIPRRAEAESRARYCTAISANTVAAELVRNRARSATGDNWSLGTKRLLGKRICWDLDNGKIQER